jgi:hypothetical protein
MKPTPKIAVTVLIVASALAQQTARAVRRDFCASALKVRQQVSTLLKGDNAMAMGIKKLAAAAAGTILATSAFADDTTLTAREIRGPTPYVAIENEPAPKLIVDPPLAEGLAQGVFWAQYRVENLRIVPVFGKGALSVSPRIGHLHVIVDELPWWWADASDNNTVDIAGLPPGKHKVTIALVDANHNVFPGQVVTLPFTVPASAPTQHLHVAN